MTEEWTTLVITYDLIEADIIKDLLESGGITVKIISAKVSPYPVNIGRMGEVKIMVRAADKSAAETMLKNYEKDYDEGSYGK